MTRNPIDAQAYATIGATVVLGIICWIAWKLRDLNFREWLVWYLYRRERKAKSLAQAVDLYFRQRAQVERDWKPPQLRQVEEVE